MHSLVCSNSLPNPQLTIAISVHNEARVPAGTRRQAEEEAQETFEQAGIAIQWLHCSPGPTEPQEARACREAVYPQHWQLRIARRPIGLAREKMGISDGKGVLCGPVLRADGRVA